MAKRTVQEEIIIRKRSRKKRRSQAQIIADNIRGKGPIYYAIKDAYGLTGKENKLPLPAEGCECCNAKIPWDSQFFLGAEAESMGIEEMLKRSDIAVSLMAPSTKEELRAAWNERYNGDRPLMIPPLLRKDGPIANFVRGCAGKLRRMKDSEKGAL